MNIKPGVQSGKIKSGVLVSSASSSILKKELDLN